MRVKLYMNNNAIYIGINLKSIYFLSVALVTELFWGMIKD